MLGVRYGTFCVVCCAALMLIMLPVVAVNLGRMLKLAAVVAVEERLPWGRHLAPVVGVGLLSACRLIIVSHAAA